MALPSVFDYLLIIVTNKKLLAGWLLLLTLAGVQTGKTVYVTQATQSAVTTQKVIDIKDSLDRVEQHLSRQDQKLDKLLEETVRVRTELELHEKADTKTAKKK